MHLPHWLSCSLRLALICLAITLPISGIKLHAEDAERLLLEFLDRWRAIEKYDVLIEADIESKTTSLFEKSENWLRHINVRQARMDQKLLLLVEMSTINEGGIDEATYRYLQDGDQTFFSNEPGMLLKGKEKMLYGGVEVSFLNSMYIKPFVPWAVTTQGEIALSRGLSRSPKIDDAFCIDRIVESSSVEKGTHAVILSKKGSTAYEIVFDNSFGGMPSVINMYPNHPKLNLKDPGSSTGYLYRSKLEWKKVNDGWYISRAIVDESNGFPPDVVRVHFDSKWTWADSVEKDLFSPPRISE